MTRLPSLFRLSPFCSDVEFLIGTAKPRMSIGLFRLCRLCRLFLRVIEFISFLALPRGRVAACSSLYSPPCQPGQK